MGAGAAVGAALPVELAAARRNTLNAHYTDAAQAETVWDAAGALGFTAGRVLEPRCGNGNFIAFAPGGACVTGIELDPVTAGIAAALYPDVDICCESFADSRDEDACYDLAIGNVPFGDMLLHDRRHNRSGHSIHNHFIVEALHLVRPGGLDMVLTRYTRDARNPAARREIAGLADLAGAIRLPGSGPAARPAGERAALTELEGVPLPVNEYFLDRQAVLGAMGAGQGACRAGDLGRPQQRRHRPGTAGPAGPSPPCAAPGC